MRFIADLHIHSKYSRATSKDMDIEHIAQWARQKGIDLIGTGDFTHPLWFEELKTKLTPTPTGLYQYKGVNFILTAEVSNIYSKNTEGRRIHTIILAPSLETAERINKRLAERGNIFSDGRPIFGFDVKDIVKICLDVSADCMIIPSHAWTPWYSVFGSNSGFDSIEECFEEEAKNIYALETGLSCYDGKTEVLTDNGWKKFSEVRYTDNIYTLNSKNNKIEFQKPIKIFTYKYKGKMYKLKTTRVDLLVTPNHKLLYSPCDFRNPKPYSLKEAQFLFAKSKRFKKDGIWIGENPKYFTLPAVKIKHGSRYYSGFRNKKEKFLPIKSWLKFFGFWIAEGWTNKGKNGDYNICVCNSDMRLLNEMKRILSSFGYKAYQRENVIRVRDYQLFYYLNRFGKCYDKFIPSDIKSLSKKLLEILLQYYIKGDGHIYGRTGKGLSATTTSIRLRDDIQEVALKIGNSAYYKLEKKKGTVFFSPGSKKLYRQRNDAWVVYFIRRNRPIVLPSTIKKYNYIESWVDYDGLVFCVTVPNHVIYIRRNGIPLWCGNSDPAMNWRLSKLDKYTLISNSDAHSPAKLGREANVFDCELSYKAIVNALKKKDKTKFLFTIEFFPEEGKYHFDGHRLCGVRFSPAQTKQHNKRCPKCGRPVTVGVMNRVEELADREEGFLPENAIPYKSLVPLVEIIAEAQQKGAETKAVEDEYRAAISHFGNEFAILLEANEEAILEKLPEKTAMGIIKVRKGELRIEPGYDGVYGRVKIFKEEELAQKKEKQMELF